MIDSSVPLALKQLRVSSAHLQTLANGHLDLNALEEAVRFREIAVSSVGKLIAQSPESFELEDLESLRACLATGKSAYEQIVTSRRHGWTVSTELSKNEYVLRAISQFGSSTV